MHGRRFTSTASVGCPWTFIQSKGFQPPPQLVSARLREPTRLNEPDDDKSQGSSGRSPWSRAFSDSSGSTSGIGLRPLLVSRIRRSGGAIETSVARGDPERPEHTARAGPPPPSWINSQISGFTLAVWRDARTSPPTVRRTMVPPLRALEATTTPRAEPRPATTHNTHMAATCARVRPMRLKRNMPTCEPTSRNP